MFFKATAADTQGRLSLMERTLPPGGRMPPAPRHVGNDEAYFVLHAPGLDGYFADLETLWASPDPPDRDTELALMERYGMDPA